VATATDTQHRHAQILARDFGDGGIKIVFPETKAERRVPALGSTSRRTSGSFNQLVQFAENASMVSPGSSRTLKRGAGLGGITLARTPALSIVGEMGVAQHRVPLRASVGDDALRHARRVGVSSERIHLAFRRLQGRQPSK